MTTAIRETVADLLTVPMSLNVMGQINGGGIQTAGVGSSRWVIDSSSIRGEDGTANDYGGGLGITAAIRNDGSFFGSKVTLQSAASGARLVLTGNTPELTVFDTNSIPRFDVGNLASGPGGSPAGYGFRVEDASGNLIADSAGLAAVMTSLGTSLVTSVTFTVDPSNITSVGFSLSRQATVFAMAYASGSTSGASGAYSNMWLTPDSVAFVNNFATWDKANPGIANGSGFQIATLAAGSHTYYLKAGPNAGQTLSVLRANLQVFRLGG